jgi:hypothetical protein
MNKIYLLIAAIFFAAGVGVGVLISSELGKKSDISSKYNAPDTFQAGWDAAKKKVEETPYIPMTGGQEEIKSIKGRIASVGEGQITVEARLLNPLDDEKLKFRTVKIDESTEIIIREDKDMEAIRKEQEEYNKKMDEFRQGKITVMPEVPEVNTEKKAAIQDLKEDDVVTVESAENIREALEFKASKIVVR